MAATNNTYSPIPFVGMKISDAASLDTILVVHSTGKCTVTTRLNSPFFFDIYTKLIKT